jgi:enoyl-CoA hydratase
MSEAPSQADRTEVPELQSFKLTVDGPVALLTLNRPGRANALDAGAWVELPLALRWISGRPEVRVLVLTGEGRNFCAGIEIAMMEQLVDLVSGEQDSPSGRDRLRREITRLQEAITELERLPIPVLAAIQGACFGGGVDLIGACDLRYASADARFCIKELDFGIVADVGTTQRLRHIIGLPALSELSLTAETIDAARALELGLVGRVFATSAELLEGVQRIARTIAAKPPIATQGVKHNLLYSRDHSVEEGLKEVAAWNAAMAFSRETREAISTFQAQRR